MLTLYVYQFRVLSLISELYDAFNSRSELLLQELTAFSKIPVPTPIKFNMELHVFKFQDTVTYRIVAQDANNYFYIAPESGGIYLRRSIVLSNSINNRYVV